MSQDFFADLERQLVDATSDRGRRLRRARARRAAAVGLSVVAVIAAGGGLAAAVAGSGGGAGSESSNNAPAGRGATTAQTVTVDPKNGALVSPRGASPELGAVTTAVLNATTVPGLARSVANRLVAAGAKIGNVTNAAEQRRSTTRVFSARPEDMAAAAKVARILDLPGDTLIDRAPAGVREIAGEQAAVIVLVGADRASSR